MKKSIQKHSQILCGKKGPLFGIGSNFNCFMFFVAFFKGLSRLTFEEESTLKFVDFFWCKIGKSVIGFDFGLILEDPVILETR